MASADICQDTCNTERALRPIEENAESLCWGWGEDGIKSTRSSTVIYQNNDKVRRSPSVRSQTRLDLHGLKSIISVYSP